MPDHPDDAGLPGWDAWQAGAGQRLDQGLRRHFNEVLRTMARS